MCQSKVTHLVTQAARGEAQKGPGPYKSLWGQPPDTQQSLTQSNATEPPFSWSPLANHFCVICSLVFYDVVSFTGVPLPYTSHVPSTRPEMAPGNHSADVTEFSGCLSTQLWIRARPCAPTLSYTTVSKQSGSSHTPQHAHPVPGTILGSSYLTPQYHQSLALRTLAFHPPAPLM